MTKLSDNLDCRIIICSFQKDVIAESEDIMKLGLLFGEDINATTEDLPTVLSFQHKLLQEYLSAVYIAENVKLDKTSTFLTEAFPTWEAIENHREVVQFACGMLADTDPRPITYHVAKVLAQDTNNQLNTGVKPFIIETPDDEVNPLLLLRLFEREGKVPPEINPYLCEYPACGRPLAEVLANTQLAYITNIDKNDTLQLNPSPAKIILNLKGRRFTTLFSRVADQDLDRVESERFDNLWQALHRVQENLIALHLENVTSGNVTKLRKFSQLKYFYIDGLLCNYSEAVGEDLAESINAWGPNTQLTYCGLNYVLIPCSLVTAVHKCSHLMHLKLWECNLHDKLSILMSFLPLVLKNLELLRCSLDRRDLQHITLAIREGHLTSLQELDIQGNPAGEAAVGHLLEALLSTRPNKQLILRLYETGVDEDGKHTDLSKQFETEWEAKLTGTNINVHLW